MQTIKTLLNLLVYNIENLYAAENIMQHALPSLIEKANHHSLKNALQHHFGLTEEHKKRLEDIGEILMEKKVVLEQINVGLSEKSNKGIAGLIDEANELMQAGLSAEVTDAAIISVIQKLEHYEICSYGNAHAYAAQLNLHKVAALLNKTLQEEYDADDLLTALATSAINKDGVPDGFKSNDVSVVNNSYAADDSDDEENIAGSVSERTINSPGGRAGTSHRGYGSGESRGH